MLNDEGGFHAEIADTPVIGHGPAVLAQIGSHLVVHVGIAADQYAILLWVSMRQVEFLEQFTGDE